MGRIMYRLPAEWEPQEAMVITWPHENTDWTPILDSITSVYLEMAREIAKRQRLVVVCGGDVGKLRVMLADSLPVDILANIEIVSCPTNDTWTRDHGFISLLSGSGRQLLDFRFNGWGEKFAAEKDNAINSYLAGTIAGEYVDRLDFVLEGGSIESDGEGTLLTTSQCLLAPNRNYMQREDIERRLKEWLAVDRVLWLDYGNLIGDDTDGHIDTIARFAPNHTILYIGTDNKEDAQYEDLKQMECQLQELSQDYGYRLLRLPTPDPIVVDGERLPATYANFVILNGAVLIPLYMQPEKDSEAIGIISTAFPDREIVGIDSRAVIHQHGSLHCCTMQIPAVSSPLQQMVEHT